MLFVFVLIDNQHSSELRQRVQRQHKAYLTAVADRIAFAGPLTGEDGLTVQGSLLAIDFASRAEAFDWLAKEPFTRAGVYATVTSRAFVNLWPQKAGTPRCAAGPRRKQT